MNTRTVTVAALAAGLAALAVVLLRPLSGPDEARAASVEGELTPFLRFTGSGVVTAAPDTAIVGVTTTAEAATSREALDRTSRSMKDVLARLRAIKGIGEGDLQSQGVSSYLTGAKGDRRYQASNSVQVTLHDPSLAGQVIAAANDAGADQVSGPTFALQDQKAAATEAIAKAIGEARVRADAAAIEMGVKITRLVSVGEASAPTGSFAAYDAVGGARSAGAMAVTNPVPTPEGKLQITVTVVATFEYSG